MKVFVAIAALMTLAAAQEEKAAEEVAVVAEEAQPEVSLNIAQPFVAPAFAHQVLPYGLYNGAIAAPGFYNGAFAASPVVHAIGKRSADPEPEPLLLTALFLKKLAFAGRRRGGFGRRRFGRSAEDVEETELSLEKRSADPEPEPLLLTALFLKKLAFAGRRRGGFGRRRFGRSAEDAEETLLSIAKREAMPEPEPLLLTALFLKKLALAGGRRRGGFGRRRFGRSVEDAEEAELSLEKRSADPEPEPLLLTALFLKKLALAGGRRRGFGRRRFGRSVEAVEEPEFSLVKRAAEPEPEPLLLTALFLKKLALAGGRRRGFGRRRF